MNYEELVTEGQSAREERDKIQWRLGDLAQEVSNTLGKHMVTDFAIRIFVDKGTLARYKEVASAYTPEIREEYKYLSWSHFRAAAAQNQPEDWLQKAADNSWSVENLMTQIKKFKGEPVKPLTQVRLVECYKCRKMTLTGPREAICDNFHDCKI
jgi:hypothetical protein